MVGVVLKSDQRESICLHLRRHRRRAGKFSRRGQRPPSQLPASPPLLWSLRPGNPCRFRRSNRAFTRSVVGFSRVLDACYGRRYTNTPLPSPSSYSAPLPAIPVTLGRLSGWPATLSAEGEPPWAGEQRSLSYAHHEPSQSEAVEACQDANIAAPTAKSALSHRDIDRHP